MDRSEQMDARFERRMRSYERLVKTGMRELAELRRLNRRLGRRLDRYARATHDRIHALLESRQRTEARLRAFVGRRAGRSA